MRWASPYRASGCSLEVRFYIIDTITIVTLLLLLPLYDNGYAFDHEYLSYYSFYCCYLKIMSTVIAHILISWWCIGVGFAGLGHVG